MSISDSIFDRMDGVKWNPTHEIPYIKDLSKGYRAERAIKNAIKAKDERAFKDALIGYMEDAGWEEYGKRNVADFINSVRWLPANTERNWKAIDDEERRSRREFNKMYKAVRKDPRFKKLLGVKEGLVRKGRLLKEEDEKQTMYMDDIHLKNLTLDGGNYDKWAWEDIKSNLWQQVVDKDNIEDIVCTTVAENKHWSNPTNRGWFPVLTKFSRSAGKAYFALKNEDGRQSKDQLLVSWTPVTEDEL